jgi:hypothetical protein
MALYEEIEIPCGVPNVNWFSKFKLPKFRTANVIGLQVRDCDSIIYTNHLGQEVNIARAVGTDYQNRDKIKNSIEVRGIQVDVLPPVILEDGTSIDGFTRGQALKSLGQNKWVYTVVKLKDGFDIEDLKDELGLGCNDHPPAKPATDKDFEVRLYAWIARQNRIPSFNECVKWWNSIPHSCKQTTVESKCTNVLKQIKTNNSMESIDKKEAEERAKKILNVDNKTKVIAINNKRSTYIERSFIQALEAVSKGLEVKAVGFLDGVPADEADKARKELHKSVAKMNKLFRCYAQKYNEDPTFELISMEGFMPQMIEIEPTDALV